MKRIILGLGMLLILAQNGFTKTDAEWDRLIAKATMEVNILIQKCNKEAINHPNYGNPEICVKAFNKTEQDYPKMQLENATFSYSAGLLYYKSKKDYYKAYEYWTKSAKAGYTEANRSLVILCRKYSWVCK